MNTRRSPHNAPSRRFLRRRRSRIASRGTIAAAVALSGACGNGADLPAPVDLPLAAVTEEVFVAGGATDEPWASFNLIYSAAFTASGSLAVLDFMQKRVVVMAPDGALRHELSRPGEGPGEYRQPRRLATLGDERLVVYDSGHRAFLVFGPDGELVGQLETRSGPESVAGGSRDVLRGLPGDRILVLGSSIDESVRPLDIYSLGGTTEAFYAAWDLADVTEDLVLEDSRETEGSRVTQRLNFKEKPAFSPPLLVDVLSDGRVAVVDSVGYRIKLVSPSGTVSGTLERPILPMDVTPDIEQAVRDRQAGAQVFVVGTGMSEQTRRALAHEFQEGAASRMRFADQIPVIGRMAVDSEDRVWVTRTGRDGFPDGPTDVFDANGAYLGTLPPDGLRIPDAFGPDGLMAYLERDELDAPVVRVIRLLGLEPAGG